MELKGKTLFVMLGVATVAIGVILIGRGLMLAGIFLIGLAGVLLWQSQCFVVVDEVEMVGGKVPTQAIFKRFGRAIRAEEPGLYHIWWPIDRAGKYCPTIIYISDLGANMVHAKADGEATKPVYLTVTTHTRLPRAKEFYEMMDGRRVRGEKLLTERLYYAVPQSVLLDGDAFARHIKKAVIDALREVTSRYSYTEIRERKSEIERKTREEMLRDPANLFVKAGIPPINLDIAITEIKSEEEVEKSLYAKEIAGIQAEAVKTRIKAKVEAGMDPDVAGISESGIEGKGMTIEQLRDWSIYQSMSGKRPKRRKP